MNHLVLILLSLGLVSTAFAEQSYLLESSKGNTLLLVKEDTEKRTSQVSTVQLQRGGTFYVGSCDESYFKYQASKGAVSFSAREFSPSTDKRLKQAQIRSCLVFSTLRGKQIQIWDCELQLMADTTLQLHDITESSNQRLREQFHLDAQQNRIDLPDGCFLTLDDVSDRANIGSIWDGTSSVLRDICFNDEFLQESLDCNNFGHGDDSAAWK